MTTAFKFGERGKEFFLAEMRTFPDNSRYLTVQRINTNYLSNLRANDQSETAVLAFGKMQFYFMKSTGLLSVGDCVGNDNNTLFYADGTRAKFCISNIKNLANGQLSFDFRVFEETLDQSIVGGNQGTNNSVETNRDIFVSVILQNGNFGGVTKIWLFNVLTNKYEQVKTASIVYISGLPYYKISGVMPEHTKCKLAVNQYRICEVAEIAITNDERYTVSTRHNFLHDVGDFINDVAATVTDLFHSAFRMLFSE